MSATKEAPPPQQNRNTRPAIDLEKEAPGLHVLHNLFNQLYPDQVNPLTVTAIVKYWLGGPDPLDYISMYENPGHPELGVPPHWHYISLGLSDLHGDGRLHSQIGGPAKPSGFGFELTFRLVRQENEVSPPTWPANMMQQLAKYVYNTANLLLPGDHVSWHAPLDGNPARKVTQILMARDPQFPVHTATPNGDVQFVQIIGVMSEELQAAQHWNGLGVINLLQNSKRITPWLVTDMSRTVSIMDEDPSVAEHVQRGIAREGSNLSGVSAKCWWMSVNDDQNATDCRENRGNDLGNEHKTTLDVKPDIKAERTSPSEPSVQSSMMSGISSVSEANQGKILPGLQITFNLEAGSLLPLAIKGRVMHGRHFTFKSVFSLAAITLVAPSVTGTNVTRETPYVVQDPWLQVLIPDELAQRMAQEFQVLENPQQLRLPATFNWPEYKLSITIVNELQSSQQVSNTP